MNLVVIDGNVVVEGGILKTMDMSQAMEGVRAGKSAIRRSGLEETIVPKWPVVK